MNQPATHSTIALLTQMRSGDAGAEQKLYPLVYGELRNIAGALFARQPSDHTLQPTALVHEVYLRMSGKERDWEGRSHFIDIAAKAMRQILIDHARKRKTAKRGGDFNRVHITDSVVLMPQSDVDILALEEALDSLEKLDARKGRVVELRFFGGLTLAEIGTRLEISPKTVEADWYFARAWLRQFMAR